MVGSGPILMTFGALETGFKFHDIRFVSGDPGAEGALPGDGNLVASWALLR